MTCQINIGGALILHALVYTKIRYTQCLNVNLEKWFDDKTSTMTCQIWEGLRFFEEKPD